VKHSIVFLLATALVALMALLPAPVQGQEKIIAGLKPGYSTLSVATEEELEKAVVGHSSATEIVRLTGLTDTTGWPTLQPSQWNEADSALGWRRVNTAAAFYQSRGWVVEIGGIETRTPFRGVSVEIVPREYSLRSAPTAAAKAQLAAPDTCYDNAIADLTSQLKKIEKQLPLINQPQQPRHYTLVAWLDGAWCASQHPAGDYGAREIGTGIRVGRLSAYSGTPTLGGLAAAKLRLPGVKVEGFELSPLLIGGFKTINMNLGRDLSRHQEFLGNARPFGSVGLSLDFQSSRVYGQLNWFGWANDIKGDDLWSPYHFQRLEGELEVEVYRSFSLKAAGICHKGYLPEWQILGMVAAGNGYRMGVGYGHQNPFAERHSRAMLVARLEKSLLF